MQILKSNLLNSKKCEFGDFELQPDEGWKLSQTFMDYESKLLIVSITGTDETKWTNNGYNGWSIPTKEYKIDIKHLTILEFKEWKHFFNYDKIETISADKKYKLVTQRSFEPKRNSDGIREELYEIESGRLLSSSDSIAFREDKRENLLESYYRLKREGVEQKKRLDAKPDLAEFYSKELEKLKENEIIIEYFDDRNSYRLSFVKHRFLLSKGGKIPAGDDDWKSIEFQETVRYADLDQFWMAFAKDEKWFLNYTLHRGLSEHPFVLGKHILQFFNALRKEHKFTYKEYDSIRQWQNSVWSEEYQQTAIKQWCANCYKEVNYQGRYPKYICSECAAKEKWDKDGNLLEFTNLGLSGGFKIIRKNRGGQIIDENHTQHSCDCIIDRKLFFAQEARFGGIVIQRKE